MVRTISQLSELVILEKLLRQENAIIISTIIHQNALNKDTNLSNQLRE